MRLQHYLRLAVLACAAGASVRAQVSPPRLVGAPPPPPEVQQQPQLQQFIPQRPQTAQPAPQGTQPAQPGTAQPGVHPLSSSQPFQLDGVSLLKMIEII